MSKRICLNFIVLVLPICNLQATNIDEELETRVANNARRSVVAYFENHTNCNLVRTEHSLNHGIWSEGVPRRIAAGNTEVWASESNGFMTGTEGRAAFSCDHGNTDVHWDNPYIGRNTYSKATVAPHTIVQTGREGEAAVVRFILN